MNETINISSLFLEHRSAAYVIDPDANLASFTMIEDTRAGLAASSKSTHIVIAIGCQ